LHVKDKLLEVELHEFIDEGGDVLREFIDEGGDVLQERNRR